MQGRFTGDDDTWEVVEELIQEHCIFIAHRTGHYLVVLGYGVSAAPESARYVIYADPADESAGGIHEMDWDGTYMFYDRWDDSTYLCRLHVDRPIPIEMEFLPNTPNSGEFTIRATVRTCHPYPSSYSGSGWYRVNQNCDLKGIESEGEGEGEYFVDECPIQIDYPQGVTKIGGDDIQYLDPDGPVDDATFSWVFEQDGSERGGEFTVTATGWAVNYPVDGAYHTDVLRGTGVFRVDERIWSIKGSEGNIVAAIGDQGNIYLYSLEEWSSSITNTAEEEVIFKRGEGIVAKIAEDGTLQIGRLCHGGVDGLNDTRTPVDSDIVATGWLSPAIDDEATEMVAYAYQSSISPYALIDDEVVMITDYDSSGSGPTAFSCDLRRRREGTVPTDHAANTEVYFLGSDETHYLQSPPTGSVIFRNALGEVVAYIDSDGNLRHKGLVMNGWSHWDYWE